MGRLILKWTFPVAFRLAASAISAVTGMTARTWGSVAVES